MRFVHTADWQIGKVFKRFGEREALFREARLDAIEALGQLARREGARHVLVAGDIYDQHTPLRTTLWAPLERMRRHPEVIWHLLPGNHDPHRPKGLWEQLTGDDLPANVRPRLSPHPVEIEPGVFLLPAPLVRRTEPNDLTAWMDQAETPPGAIRIGLAHGSVTGFDSQGDAGNPIDPARPARAGLAYLALGDWHRTLKIGERVWYAGTPEPDRSGSQEVGTALVVDVAGAQAPPLVRPESVGTYRWMTRAVTLGDEGSVQDLEALVRALEALPRLVLRLDLSGAVSMAARTALGRTLDRLSAAVCHLDADLSALQMRPNTDDLDGIDFDGALRRVAQRLQARLAEPGLTPADQRITEDALIRLFTLTQAGTAA